MRLRQLSVLIKIKMCGGNGESSSVVWRRKTRTNLWYFTNFSQGDLKYVSVSILDYTATDPELNCRGDDCTAEKHREFGLNISDMKPIFDTVYGLLYVGVFTVAGSTIHRDPRDSDRIQIAPVHPFVSKCVMQHMIQPYSH